MLSARLKRIKILERAAMLAIEALDPSLLLFSFPFYYCYPGQFLAYWTFIIGWLHSNMLTYFKMIKKYHVYFKTIFLANQILPHAAGYLFFICRHFWIPTTLFDQHWWSALYHCRLVMYPRNRNGSLRAVLLDLSIQIINSEASRTLFYLTSSL
jgi:hypothetical protein